MKLKKTGLHYIFYMMKSINVGTKLLDKLSNSCSDISLRTTNVSLMVVLEETRVKKSPRL